MNLETPAWWVSTTLDELITHAIGGDWGVAPEIEGEDLVKVSCIRGTEIRNWEKERGATAALRKVKRSKFEGRALREGDILLEVSGGGPEQPVGRTVLIDRQCLSLNPELPKIPTNFLRLLRPAPVVEPRFLDRFLRFFYVSGDVAKYQGGSNNLRNLKFQDYISITIPLPPLAEQKRIVAKIEELFSELEAGEESLRVARRQLGVYRQSLLKQAFEGHLTAKWRTQNPDKLESPAQLLARIQSARQARFEQQPADGQIDPHGIRLAKTKAPRSIAPFTANEMAAFPTLPASWAREKLGRLFRIVSGHTPKEISHTQGGVIPYYRVSDMNATGNELHMKASSTWLTGSQTEQLGLHIYPAGTVIFPKRGGAILTNKKRVLSRPSCFDLNTMGVINDEPSIDSDFLRWWFIKLDLSKIYDGSNIPQINNKNVEHLPFELPSLPEQQEIVRLLDEQFEVIERNEREIDGALRQSEALRQAILQKAFTGRLVPQDPSDEPASTLLARLRTEREPQRQARIQTKLSKLS